MRVLVCGDRNWTDEVSMFAVMMVLPPGTIVIHGGAKGADSIAGKVAKQMGLDVIEFPADWRRYGTGAGPVRNQQMLDEGHPDLVLAFHGNIAASKGTANMLKKAKAAGIPYVLYDGKQPTT